MEDLISQCLIVLKLTSLLTIIFLWILFLPQPWVESAYNGSSLGLAKWLLKGGDPLLEDSSINTTTVDPVYNG